MVLNKALSNAKISVGITAYKNSEYLLEALNSLIDQSVDSWEGIFILDKGADMKTKKIFNSFVHPRILKHRCKDHKGAEQARHEAIKLSSTNWYFQLDSDDMAELAKLERGRRFNDPGDFTLGMNTFCPIYE